MKMTWKFLSGYLVDKIADRFGVKKATARKLLVDAISYNVVVAEIMDQVDFLLDRMDPEEWEEYNK